MDKEAKTGILRQRIEYMQQQMYDTQLNIKIYARVSEHFGKAEDKQILENEREKLLRFEMAYDTLLKERS